MKVKDSLYQEVNKDFLEGCGHVIQELRNFAQSRGPAATEDEDSFWSMLQSADHTLKELEDISGRISQTTGKDIQRDGGPTVKGLVEIFSRKIPLA